MNSSMENYSSSGKEGRLMGKVAIVTGGARGIGAAIARIFASQGAHVVIADILDDLGLELEKHIHGCYVHCDVTNEEDVEAAVRAAVAWRGRLDIMVNNAGVAAADCSITNINTNDLKRTMAVNLMGVVHGIKHAARVMINANDRKGTIICISSTSAVMGGLASHSYTLSKAAVLGLARTAACELGSYGIRVNCISPHGVPSEMLVKAYQKSMKTEEIGAVEVGRIVGEYSVLKGRAPTVDDVGHAALFLASDESGNVNGHNLVLDGGFTVACTNMRSMYQ